MAPKTRRSQPKLRHDPRNRRETEEGTLPAAPASPLAALSEASEHYARATARKATRRLRFSRRLPIGAALAVGAALAFAGRFEYPCGATIQITGENAAARIDAYRRNFLDHAWRHLADSRGDPVAPRWYVDSPAQGLLRLTLISANRRAGVDTVQRIAEAYLANVEQERDKALRTPTQSEELLSEYARELRRRLDQTQTQLEILQASLPASDPGKHRASLLDAWHGLRTRFASARAELTRARTELARLRSEPEPTHGIVPSDVRREALEADRALQQDLRELQVNLVELKLHLLEVWQQSAQPLGQLHSAAGNLQETAARRWSATPAEPERRQMQQLVEEVDEYQAAARTFDEAWNQEFNALRQVASDLLTSEVLDVYQQARNLLNDFLFDAGKRLTAARTIVETFRDAPGDHARYHVLQSDLTRAYQVLQSTHHRFEFAAGAIEAQDNFRLDAALKATRGLRRRSQRRIRDIDERLQAQALRRARQQRVEALKMAEEDVAHRRSMADAIVEELVTLQDELNLSAGLTDEFLRASLRMELTEGQVKLTEADLAAMDRRLRDLATERASLLDGVKLELLECGVLGGSVNFPRRLRFAGLGAVLTLLTVALGQWWLIRRS